MDILREQPEKVGPLLLHFTRQVREMDDLALFQAFAPQSQRVNHALVDSGILPLLTVGDPGVQVAKIGPKQIAKSAQLQEKEVLRVLDIEKQKGVLDYRAPLTIHESAL